MIAQSWAESTREITNYGRFINQFPPNIIRSIRQFERINKKICRQKMSIMFNQIYIYIYIYICVCVCGLVSLFNGISTLFWLFNAKAILLEKQLWYNLTHSWEDKGVISFPRVFARK